MTELDDFRIVAIKDRGNMENERIVLQATKEGNLISYLVIPAGYDEQDKSIIDLNRYVFWFPPVRVAENDFVVIYTRQGDNKSFKNKSKSMTYHFFWGLKDSLWTRPGVNAVSVLRIDAWLAKPVK